MPAPFSRLLVDRAPVSRAPAGYASESMPGPRILFVDHSGALGGAELFLLDLAEPYAGRSTVATFETGRFTEQLQATGISHLLVGEGGPLQQVRKSGTWMRALQTLPALRRTGQALARTARRHDIIVANSQKALLPAAWAAHQTGRPLLWMIHDLLTPDHFGLLQRQVVTRVANAAATLVGTNSRATADAFSRTGGRVDMIEIPNGLDPAAFDAARTLDTHALRKTLGLPLRAPLIGVFSRLAAWKGQHVLLDALHMLPDAHALIVGEAAFPGDAPYADRLRAKAQSAGLQGRVHFMGHRPDIPRLMIACDIVAHTSTAAEPFGRVVVEGLLAQRPVVATDAGGVPEIIRPQHSGLLVPPGNAAALAEACRAYMNNPDWAAKMARTGAEDVRIRYGKPRMHAQFENAVRQMTPADTSR